MEEEDCCVLLLYYYTPHRTILIIIVCFVDRSSSSWPHIKSYKSPTCRCAIAATPSQYTSTHCETFEEQYGCVHKIHPSEEKEQDASCQKDGGKKAATCEKKGQVEDQRSGWEKRKIPCNKKVCQDAQKDEKSVDPKESENA